MVALHVMPCQVNGKKQVGYAMIVLPCLALNRMIIVVSYESPLEATNISKAGNSAEYPAHPGPSIIDSLVKCQNCD